MVLEIEKYEALHFLNGYRIWKARLPIVIKDICQLEKTLDQTVDDMYEQIALGIRNLDGMPKTKKVGSRTEYLALNSTALVNTPEVQGMKRRLTELSQEKEFIKENIALYRAAKYVLSDFELGFVKYHYEQGISYSKMLEVDIQPGLKVSQSTLYRTNKMVIKKMNQVLHSSCIGPSSKAAERATKESGIL